MSLFGRKPKTLGEVIRRVKEGEQKFDPSLREFLNSFYVDPTCASRRSNSAQTPSMLYMMPMSRRSQSILLEFTDCRYQSGARPMVTGFVSHSLLAVFSL